jgi:hypothetical protein
VRFRAALLSLLAPSVPLACSRADASPPDSSNGRERAPAVVELFTSEGCSSCPPADDVLRDLVEGPPQGGGDVYVLEFHVDYWDELGWVDPFSAPWATDRQRQYAQMFGERGVYTPQMVVGGRDAFVGSDRAHARTAVERAWRRRPSVRISLRARPQADEIAVDYELSAAPSAATVLNLAMVEPSATVRVAAGENGGRTLRHVNIVRSFETVPLAGKRSGHAVLRRPSAWGASRADIIAYAQDGRSLAIDAATRTSVALP